MATYEVKAPDGSTWEVNAPDQASEQDVLSYAKNQWKPTEVNKPSPADGVSRLQALAIAAGKKTDSILDGLTQMYLGAGGEGSALAALKQSVQQKEATYKPLREKYPFVTGVGEAVPSLAVPVTGGPAAVVGTSALAAALPEALSYGSVEERLKRAGIAGTGGALGAMGGMFLGRLIKPAGKSAQVADDALAAAERIGFKPSAGQVTQNPALQNFENYLSRSVGSSDRMLGRAQANQTALNRAAAKAVGETADNVGEGVLGAASKNLGREFERLQQITGPDMARPEFMQALIKVDSANVAKGPYASARIAQEVDKALELATQGKISGSAYQEIRSELSSAASSAFKSGDSTVGQAIKTIREAMDDAAKASLGSADQKAWDVVRKQWEAYKVLVKGNVAEAGNVSAARVASKLRVNDPRFRTGQLSGELADIARVGEAFKGVQNPNSGQLARPQIDTLFGLLRAGADNAASRAYMSGPMQSYLTNTLPMGPNATFMLNRGGGLLGVPGTAAWLGVE